MFFQRIKRRNWTVTASVLVLAAVTAWTCGYDWPNTLLLDSEKELVTSPVALFSEGVETTALAVPPLDWLKVALERDRSPGY